VVNHEFVDFDDGAYIDRNTHVSRGLTWEGLRWSVTTFHMGNWHPLTWLSHMLDWELFGEASGAHHLVSVLLHAASAAALYVALLKMTGSTWPAAFVAALFALHPLRVESVAWAAERKDVLSTLFWMLTLLAYAAYVARPGAARYALVAGSFALGLLAKPMLVTLPCVLLLLDVWPLGRWRRGAAPGEVGPGRLLLEKVPLFAMAALSSMLALVAQRSVGAVGSLDVLALAVRLQNAMVSYVAYLWKSLWPTGLAFYYPHPALTAGSGGVSASAALASGLLLAAITLAAVIASRRRPYLGVGWFWYLGTLVPVIGLLQVGMQARADRYTYVPTVGLYLAVAWALAEWSERSPGARRLVSAGCALAVAACLVATWLQVGTWRDSRSVAEHALRVTENNFPAHNMLGVVEQRERDPAAALASYRRALEIKPDFTEGQLNLATLLGEQGRLDESAMLFELALRVNPVQAGLRAHNGLGALREKQGDFARAVAHLEQAVRLDPEFAEAHNNLGVVFEKTGRPDAARAEYERALELSPDYAVAHRNLGGMLKRQGDLAGAAGHLLRAIELDPSMTDARFKLAAVHATQGRLADAARQFERVLEDDPELAEAHYNLGIVLAELGQVARAAAHLEQALALKPDYAAAHQALEALR
jgi:tetratricopeptide (TPR) repeat protein